MCDEYSNDLQVSNMRLQEDRDKWRDLCLGLVEIVKNEGLSPRYGKDLLEKHRKEWPLLWSQIDKMGSLS